MGLEPRRPGTIRLPEHLRAPLRTLALNLGEIRAAEAVGIGRSTLLRVVAGLPVRRGTAALVAQRLAALNGAGGTQEAA